MPSISNLFGDKKYADSIIDCDGQLLHYHKAIVCSRSEILAHEFDDKCQGCVGQPIKHVLYDYYTVERVLEYIYNGSYTVDASTLHYDVTVTSTNGNIGNGSAINGTHVNRPHRGSGNKIAITNVMTAHVLAYAAADHYQLPDLKSLALKNFKDSKAPLVIESFIKLSKAIYRCTQTNDDPLRKEFLRILLADYSEWLGTESFSGALVSDIGLHEFTVGIITVLGDKGLKSAKKEKAAAQAQAEATKVLLSSLDQNNEALAKSNNRVQVLESAQKALKAENQELKAENQQLRSAHAAAQTKVEGLKMKLANTGETKERIFEAEGAAKSLTMKITKLEHALEDSRNLRTALEESLKTSKEKLEKETARANKNFELCKARDASIREKDEAIKKESTRADEDADRCKDWEEAWETENARAEKAVRIIQSIVRQVNRLGQCRNCGIEVTISLSPDDRVGCKPGKVPFNACVRSKHCAHVEYGKYVTD